MSTSTKIKKPAPRPANWLDGSNKDTWHSSAPGDVIETYSANEGQEGWESWTDFLEARKGRPLLAELLTGGETALLWSMPEPLLKTETHALVTRLGDPSSFEKRSRRRRWADAAANWLDAASIASASAAHAYECLAWAYALPQLPNCVGENLWWKLLNHFVAISREAQQLAADRDPLIRQLLAGELPLALSYALPEIRACHDLSLAAWSTISASLEELLDVDGVPKGAASHQLPALVASWSRSRALANRVDRELWQDPASRRHELALLSSARLGNTDRKLFRACRAFDLDKSTQRLMRLLSSSNTLEDGKSAAYGLPSPAMHSEESRLAVLRTDWTDAAPKLSIDYGRTQPHMELSIRGEIVLSGDWHHEVRIDGEPRSMVGAWETVCWFSDKDVDFLEIEAPLGDGFRLQRQLLLARADHVLLAADVILSERSCRIELRTSLPLCTQVGFHGAEETREGQLVGNHARALAIPLALPEWRSDSRRGTLEVTRLGLTLRQNHEGRAAYAPLLVDLDGKRSRKACTWRQLTVAEARNTMATDVAVGYRAQVGKSNWLVYRSLAEPSIRSLLGQQVKAEFLFGRMKANGGCSRLLEIEDIEEV